MEILLIITLAVSLISVIISVITLLTQKRLAENIGVSKITDEHVRDPELFLHQPEVDR